jgi:hypothetical protein
MARKSSRKRARQILGVISPARAEALLTDWANLSGPWPLKFETKESLVRIGDERRRLYRRYKDLLDRPQFPVLGHPWLRDMLRRAWDTSDVREREWLCFRFRDAYSSMLRRSEMSPREMREEDLAADVAGARFKPPPVTPVEAAFFHLQRQAHRARHCRNPECPAPYFFASKHTQIFCSTPCALPTQRASKRKWWARNRSSEKTRTV